MTVPVIRLPITANNSNLTSISPSDLSLVSEYEYGALAHWVFGGDSSCLTSRVSGHTLTESGTITYNSNSVVCAGTSGYLESDINDTADMTAVVLFKRPAADGVNQFALLGSWNNSAGMYIVLTGTGSLSLAYQMTSGAVVHGVNAEASMVEGAWLAGAAVLNMDGGSKAAASSYGLTYEADDTSAQTLPMLNNTVNGLRIGASVSNPGYSTNSREISEVILFDRALTEAEVKAVILRAQIRAAGRSITLVLE